MFFRLCDINSYLKKIILIITVSYQITLAGLIFSSVLLVKKIDKKPFLSIEGFYHSELFNNLNFNSQNYFPTDLFINLYTLNRAFRNDIESAIRTSRSEEIVEYLSDFMFQGCNAITSLKNQNKDE